MTVTSSQTGAVPERLIGLIEIVSPGKFSNDYIVKLNLYADAGVREYWIVDPTQESIFVYYLEKANFKAEAHTFQD